MWFIWNKLEYRNVPKFSDRQVWANSADPDQTAPRGAVWSGSTLFAIPAASFGCITLRKSHLVQLLGWLLQIFWVSEILGFLRYEDKTRPVEGNNDPAICWWKQQLWKESHIPLHYRCSHFCSQTIRFLLKKLPILLRNYCVCVSITFARVSITFAHESLIQFLHMSHAMKKPIKWHVRPEKTQISLVIRPVWSES